MYTFNCWAICLTTAYFDSIYPLPFYLVPAPPSSFQFYDLVPTLSVFLLPETPTHTFARTFLQLGLKWTFCLIEVFKRRILPDGNLLCYWKAMPAILSNTSALECNSLQVLMLLYMEVPWRLFASKGVLYCPSILAVENFVWLEITEPDSRNLGIYFSHNTVSRGSSAG